MDDKILHLALVGGQTMPVYLALQESKASKVVLVYSLSSKVEALGIRQDVENSTIEREVVLVEMVPIEYNIIQSSFEKILDSYKDWIIEANVSSGTKPWTIVLALLSAKYTNLHLIYVDQQNVIYDLKTAEKHIIHVPCISEMLKFNQTKVKSYRNLDEYTEDDYNVLDDIKMIRNKYMRVHGAFNTLTIPSRENKNKFDRHIGYIEDPRTGSEIQWNKEYQIEGSDEVIQHVCFSFLDRYGKREDFELDSPHAFDLVISSGWFEYEVATILRKWELCDEIWLNTVFPYNNTSPKNEIDIIVKAGDKLVFVECKTQIFDKTDIDKFASAVKNYGGLSAKAIFITSVSMDEQAKEKCRTNNIENFSFCDKNRNQVKHAALFSLFNSIIQNNNIR